jgi:hypothetical protein
MENQAKVTAGFVGERLRQMEFLMACGHVEHRLGRPSDMAPMMNGSGQVVAGAPCQSCRQDLPWKRASGVDVVRP